MHNESGPPFAMPGVGMNRVPTEVARLAAVSADLTLWLETGGPDPNALAGAPTLSNWVLEPNLHGFTLAGIVHRHPYIGNGRAGRTSQIVAIARDLTWARSLNRLWSLQSPRPSASDA